MSETKNDFSAIRIGTRIRHLADGAIGRIVWANATTVKVQWDDGEKVNWKRAELASKGLEIIDDDQVLELEPTEVLAAEQPMAEVPALAAVETTETASSTEAVEPTTAPETLADKPTDPTTGEPTTTEQPAKQPKRRARTPAPEGTKKSSAIDAAAKVLAEEGKPMGCKELIGAMAMKGYWNSPGGKTPAATLYSALLREIDTKGDASRFVKVGRGMFGLRPQA
jgi:hypothetical protein